MTAHRGPPPVSPSPPGLALSRRRLLAAGALLLGGTRAAALPPLLADLSADARARIDALLARMTLEEKAGQLSLYAAVTADPSANPQTHVQNTAQQLADVRAGRVTGLFNGDDVGYRRAAQQAAVHGSRLGIPLLMAGDVIHGLHTVFPVPLAETATWEPALAERTARAAAIEASASGLRWTFAPMADIARDARWGRAIEGAGEDVLLASRFVAARVRGFQGRDLSEPDTLLATPKHFAGYGAAEGGLDYNAVELSERTLREVYLPPFHAALEAGALAVMSAFNTVGGVPSSANPALLGGVLRDDWGFQGVVVSDYTSDEELIAHGVAADARDAARQAFLAGTDISMQSGLYMQHLPALVTAGQVPLARLDDAVRRVLALKERLGLFADPLRGLAAGRTPDWPEHRALARDVARRSIVLLKNEGDLLPLPRAGRRIALIGPFGSGPGDLLGRWTLSDNRVPPVALDQSLRDALDQPLQLTVVPGCAVDAPLPGGIQAAVAAARRADVVLLAVGESERMAGESHSRTSIEVPPAQRDLAAAVLATGKPVVVLLRNGRAIALTGALREAQAIVVTWFLGQQTGPAVADVLFGEVSPSGRLPVSFPQASGQVPYHYDHLPTGRGLPPGAGPADFKTRYVDASHDALYPFGHGLTYGRVVYEALSLSGHTLPWDGSLQVEARLTNTGPRAVDEVAQLYVHQRVASVSRPVRQLKDFRKLRIAPGSSARVAFTLRRDDLTFVGRDLRWTAEPGAFDLWVGPSAAEGLQSGFELLPA